MAALNDRDRRAFRATLLACTLSAAAAALAAGSLTRGFQAWTFEELRLQRAAEGRLRAPPLTLQAAGGVRPAPWSPAIAAAGRPRVTIVDFIFTRCETVCLALGTGFQQMQRRLQSARGTPGVQLLSISFDVERDRPADLAAYARRHGADPVWWQVAAPTDAAQNRALLHALGVVAIPDGLGGFVHNAALHVIDAQGRVRGLYPLEDWERALDQARRIADAASEPGADAAGDAS